MNGECQFNKTIIMVVNKMITMAVSKIIVLEMTTIKVVMIITKVAISMDPQLMGRISMEDQIILMEVEITMEVVGE